MGFLFLVVHFRLLLPPAARRHHTTCSLTHNLSPHTCPHITCSHTTCSHTPLTRNLSTRLQLVLTQLVTTQLAHTHNFAWQAWRLWQWAGCGGALGSQLAPWTPWTPWLFAWQAWHLATSTVTLRGRRGTYGTGLGGALGSQLIAWTPQLFAWQAWHLATWHWAGSGRALGSQLTPWSPRLFAWQAWHLATSASTLRGRRGTWRHRRAFCVAGVALMALGWLWRAWFPVDAVDAVALWVACVALGDIDRHFAWQAWHLATSTFTLRGRRGTYGTGLGGALGSQLTAWTPQLFAWQAWHLATWHWAGSCGALGSQLTPWTPWLFGWHAWHLATSTVTLRGKRGTWRHRPSLCVAGVALMALGWLSSLRGRRGTWRHRRAFCVAGVALMALGWLWWRAWFPVIGLHFAWQAWHLVTCTCTLHGRRGIYGTGLALVARLVPS